MVQFTRKKKAFHTSKQPRKKRKALYTAPLHAAAKRLNAHLSKELRQKLKKRSERVRKGDKVKVLVGKHAGKTGKVLSASIATGALTIENASVKKQGGKEIFSLLPASNVLITELSPRDKVPTREAKIERKTEAKEQEKKEAHAETHGDKKE